MMGRSWCYLLPLATLLVTLPVTQGIINGADVAHYTIHYRAHVTLMFPYGGQHEQDLRQAAGVLINNHVVITTLSSFFSVEDEARIKVYLASEWQFSGQPNAIRVWRFVEPSTIQNDGRFRVVLCQLVVPYQPSAALPHAQGFSHLAMIAPEDYSMSVGSDGDWRIFHVAGFHGSTNNMGHLLTQMGLRYAPPTFCLKYFADLHTAINVPFDVQLVQCYVHESCESFCASTTHPGPYDDGGGAVLMHTNQLNSLVFGQMVGTGVDGEAEPVVALRLERFQTTIVEQIRVLKTDEFEDWREGILDYVSV